MATLFKSFLELTGGGPLGKIPNPNVKIPMSNPFNRFRTGKSK